MRLILTGTIIGILSLWTGSYAFNFCAEWARFPTVITTIIGMIVGVIFFGAGVESVEKQDKE